MPPPIAPIILTGHMHFKVRFNTTHGDTGLYWRIIVDDEEYLVCNLHCKVETRSDASFDARAGVIKYHIVGECEQLYIGTDGNALFS